jgi:hypothetical protein
MKNTFLLAAATLFITAAQAQVTDSTRNTTGTDSTRNTGTMGTTGSTGSDNSRKTNAYGSYSTRDSIAAKYKLQPMPAPLTLEAAFPILGSYQLNTPENGASDVNGQTSTTTNSATGTTTNSTTANSSTTTGTTTNGTTASTDLSGTATPITITMDSASKGIVWVEGLPQGRIKAYLSKSPATYRIIAQKTEGGTAIPEGTLYLDTTTKVLNIALGAPYNQEDPTAVFGQSTTTATDYSADAEVKTKTTKNTKNSKTAVKKPKVKFYTATKVVPVQDSMNTTNGTSQDSTSGQQ